MPAFDAFPRAIWSRHVAKRWRARSEVVLGYGDPQGYFPLRRAIAAHLSANRGIACEPEQVFIVGGAQQGFHLIGSVLLDPGEKVWFENPGAIGAGNSLVACGANLILLPIDDDGLAVSDAAVGELLAKAKKDSQMLMFRPLLKKVDKRTDGSDLQLTLDLGRTRNAVGHLVTLLAPWVMMASGEAQVIEAKAAEAAPVPVEKKKGAPK